MSHSTLLFGKTGSFQSSTFSHLMLSFSLPGCLIGYIVGNQHTQILVPVLLNIGVFFLSHGSNHISIFLTSEEVCKMN